MFFVAKEEVPQFIRPSVIEVGTTIFFNRLFNEVIFTQFSDAIQDIVRRELRMNDIPRQPAVFANVKSGVFGV